MHTQLFNNWFQKLPDSTLPASGNCLKASLLETPLGNMIAIGNEMGLYLLQFTDKKSLEREIIQLGRKTKSAIVKGKNQPILSMENELNAYFKGEIQQFHTPLLYFGSLFQQQAWDALRQVPYGKTNSYAELASAIGKPSAYRAVANANGANHLTIVIPCHRIITSKGEMGGYSAGIHRKKWLLEHEKRKIDA